MWLTLWIPQCMTNSSYLTSQTAADMESLSKHLLCHCQMKCFCLGRCDAIINHYESRFTVYCIVKHTILFKVNLSESFLNLSSPCLLLPSRAGEPLQGCHDTNQMQQVSYSRIVFPARQFASA